MYGRKMGRVLWVAVLFAAAAIVVLLVVLLAQPGSEGPGPMVTPTTTATDTVDTTATATVDTTATAGSTAWHTGTPASTATGGPTSTSGATASAMPTPTATSTAIDVYFTESSVNVSGEYTSFYLQINMSSGAEIPYFYGGQWVLEWNCSLFEIRNAWTQNNAIGRLWNGTEWIENDVLVVSITGSNPSCPNPSQGRSPFTVTWQNYCATWGEGVTIPAGKEGTLVDQVRFRTYTGDDFKTGTTEILFVPTKKLTGYLGGTYEYSSPVEWTGTKVEVN